MTTTLTIQREIQKIKDAVNIEPAKDYLLYWDNGPPYTHEDQIFQSKDSFIEYLNKQNYIPIFMSLKLVTRENVHENNNQPR